MTEIKFRYDTPSAFRKALKDRFGQIARADRRYSLDELQRQFAYDRVLARLFSSNDADRWVLKGARQRAARPDAVRGLPHRCRRGTAMTATPDVVAPLTPLDIDRLVRPYYRVFPIADHLADKLCAIIGTYAATASRPAAAGSKTSSTSRSSPPRRPSVPTRCASLLSPMRHYADLSFPNDSQYQIRPAGPPATHASPPKHPAPPRTTTQPSTSPAESSIRYSPQVPPARGTRRCRRGTRNDSAQTACAKPKIVFA